MKKSLKLLSAIVICTILSNCNTITSSSNISLQKNDSIIKINISSDISSVEHDIRFFKDKGIEYLAIEGKQNKLISIYKLADGSHIKTIKPQIDGPQGIGAPMFGFDIVNLDTIFISTRGFGDKIFMIDSSAVIKKEIKFEISQKPYFPLSFLLSNRGYTTNYTNNTIAISNVWRAREEEWNEKNKLSIGYCYNLVTNEPSNHPLNHPQTDENEEQIFPSEGNFIRNGKKTILTYRKDHNVYVSTDNKAWQKYNLRSNMIKKPFTSHISSSVEELLVKTAESPLYLCLIYDKYRDVYYRFVYPGIELGANDDAMMLNDFYRQFSIMIIDKDFNLIGETVMPEKTYNANAFFINEAGLWISTNTPENPKFEEDAINFQLFTLE